MLGERLKAARLALGMSQRDLAKRCSVSAMAISKYERNLDMPSSGVLLRLAKACKCSIDYFFRTTTVTLSEPMYRCQPTFSARQKSQLQMQVQQWLERYFEVESFLPSEQIPQFQLPPESERYASSMEDIENIADRLRRTWNLSTMSPIENLLALLEDRGIKVGLVEAPDGFDACVMWANDTLPVMAVKQGLPGDRQRFSLAHELSHIVMLTPEGNLEEETIANRFAGAFLAPREAVFHELGPKRSQLHLYELHLLKHKYGLSMQGWIHRAVDLEILPLSKAKQLRKKFREKGWYRVEPGHQLLPEKLTRMERLIVQLLVENVISESRASELLGQPLQKFWQEVSSEHGKLPVSLCS